MASKIRQLEAALGAGARTNKYRVIFPYFGQEIDIQTHAMSSPGSSMGVAEVYLKGRKYQIAGDRADEGSMSLTFYNDPDLLVRRFFLQIIDGIQNFNTPITIENGSNMDTLGRDFLSSNNFSGYSQKNISNRISSAYDEIRRNFDSLSSVFRGAANYLSGGQERSLFSSSVNGMDPWYQSTITIQQLDNNMDVSTETTVYNAFVTDVSAIEYTDEVGDISTTTITLAYTGIDYDRANI